MEDRTRERGPQRVCAVDAVQLQRLFPFEFGALDRSMDGNSGCGLHVRPKPVFKPPTEVWGGEAGLCSAAATGVGSDGSVGRPALLPVQISKCWQRSRAAEEEEEKKEKTCGPSLSFHPSSMKKVANRERSGVQKAALHVAMWKKTKVHDD